MFSELKKIFVDEEAWRVFPLDYIMLLYSAAPTAGPHLGGRSP